jgi:hypothetical protein
MMKAGRELDALVTEKIMGWKRGRRYGNGNGEWIRAEKEEYPLTWNQTPRHSTSIEKAWQVIEQMARTGWFFVLEYDSTDCLDVAFYRTSKCDGGGAEQWITGPLADAPRLICVAALKALGIEVDDE